MTKKSPPRPNLLQGTLDLLILHSLQRGPLHGYAIAQTIHILSGEVLKVEEGSLYPALLRMLKAGWVSAEWGVSARNRRVRVYRITTSGRKQLVREVSAFDQMMEGIARVMKAVQS